MRAYSEGDVSTAGGGMCMLCLGLTVSGHVHPYRKEPQVQRMYGWKCS